MRVAPISETTRPALSFIPYWTAPGRPLQRQGPIRPPHPPVFQNPSPLAEEGKKLPTGGERNGFGTPP